MPEAGIVAKVVAILLALCAGHAFTHDWAAGLCFVAGAVLVVLAGDLLEVDN